VSRLGYSRLYILGEVRMTTRAKYGITIVSDQITVFVLDKKNRD